MARGTVPGGARRPPLRMSPVTQTVPDATFPPPARRAAPRTGGGQARTAAPGGPGSKADAAKRPPKAIDFKQALVAADRLLGPATRPRLAIAPAGPGSVAPAAAAAPAPRTALVARADPPAARPAYDPAAPFFFPETAPGAVGGNWAWARAGVARERGQHPAPAALASAAPVRTRAPAPAATAAANPDAAFRQRIAEAERSAEHPGGGYGLRNAGSGALGRYQLMRTALRDIGWRDDGGGWTEAAARHGVTSEEAFLASPAAQEAAMGRYLDRVETQLDRNGAAARAGATVTGLDGEAVPVTRAGLVAAAHRRGAAAVARYLAHRTASPEAAARPEQREAFAAVEKRLRDFAAPSLQAGATMPGGRRSG